MINLYRKSVFIAILCLCFSISWSQDAFDIKWKEEWLHLGSGLVGNGIGLLLQAHTPGMTYDQNQEILKNKINNFDRKATTYQSLKIANISDILFYSSVALPVIVYGLKIKNVEWRESSIMFGEVLLYNAALTNIAKYSIRRPRPHVYLNPLFPGEEHNYSARASFYSGHTSFAASNSFFGAALFHRAYPDSDLIPVVYGFAAVLPAAVGIARVRSGNHFPTDVIAGYIMGATTAYLVIQSHKRKNIEIGAGVSGLAIMWKFQ